MPLSDEEQRILEEIERQFRRSDPRLVKNAEQTSAYRHSAKQIKIGAAGFLLGLAVMVFGFSTSLLIGLLGFAVMLAGALWVERGFRGLGRAGVNSFRRSLSSSKVAPLRYFGLINEDDESSQGSSSPE